MRIQISQSSGSTERTQNSDSKICSCKGKFLQSHVLRSMLGTYVLCDSTVGVVSYVYALQGVMQYSDNEKMKPCAIWFSPV